MKYMLRGLVFVWLMTASFLLAQPQFSPQEARLLEPFKSREAFEQAWQTVKQQGANPMLLDISRILFAIRDESGEYMNENLESFRALTKTYSEEYMDIHFLVGAAEAKHAFINGQFEEAERLLKNVWWQFPQGGGLLSEMAEEVKKVRYFSELKVDLEHPTFRFNEEPVTLRELLKENKGVMVGLWAQWCKVCMISMPEWNSQAERLQQKGVILVGMNVDKEEGQQKATAVHEQHGIRYPWLLDNADRHYAKLFRAFALPGWVLLDREGKVIFAANPKDPRWEKILDNF